MILLRNRIKEDKIVQYHVGQAFFTPSQPRIVSFPYLLPGSLVDPVLPGVVFQKILSLCRKFQFIGNFKVTQYFVTIEGPHFQWLKYHIKLMIWLENNVFFLPKRPEKHNFFLKIWLEFQL